MIRIFTCQYLVLSMLSLIILPKATAQWEEIELPRPQYLYDNLGGSWAFLGPMEWVDEEVGYVFERNGVYYKTTNGGVEWIKDTIEVEGLGMGLGYLPITECDFATRDFGVVALVATASNFIHFDSAIVVTTDGGKTWQRNEIMIPGRVKRTGTTIRALENGGIVHGCGRVLAKDTVTQRNIYEEIVCYSSDLGLTWDVLATDTLVSNDDRAKTTEWLFVDSMTVYRFTYEGIGDFYISYVKATYDGGKSWDILQHPIAPDHPLASSKVGNRLHLNIDMMNDTSLVVVMGSMLNGTPGFGMVTRERSKHALSEGWVRVDASGMAGPEVIVDMGLWDGKLFYLTSKYFDQDSLVVVELSNPERRVAVATPRVLNHLYSGLTRLHIPRADMAYLWTRQAIWKYNHSTSGVGDPALPALEGGMVPYPNPNNINLHRGVTFETEDLLGKNEVFITITDIYGRQIASERVSVNAGAMFIANENFAKWESSPGVYIVTAHLAEGRNLKAKVVITN